MGRGDGNNNKVHAQGSLQVHVSSIKNTRPNWAKQLPAKGLRANTKLRKAKAKRVTTSEGNTALLLTAAASPAVKMQFVQCKCNVILTGKGLKFNYTVYYRRVVGKFTWVGP